MGKMRNKKTPAEAGVVVEVAYSKLLCDASKQSMAPSGMNATIGHNSLSLHSLTGSRR
ncbi:hypothetical protein [Paenibacillus sp. NPDC058071]|uniref:hypothetical protein n=1 Tax=Paenibacillus sp. NPDC058071 TaxID=3346326 RepID=UPI0036DD57E8